MDKNSGPKSVIKINVIKEITRILGLIILVISCGVVIELLTDIHEKVTANQADMRMFEKARPMFDEEPEPIRMEGEVCFFVED